MYDLMLPIGERCCTYMALKNINPTQPKNIFDDLGNCNLDVVDENLKTCLDYFLKKEEIQFSDILPGDGRNWFAICNQIRIQHIFKKDLPFEESLEKYYQTLDYIKKKTISRIKSSSNILMIYCAVDKNYTVEQIIATDLNIRSYFPEKRIDFLVYMYQHKIDGCPYIIYDNNGINMYNIFSIGEAKSIETIGNDIFNIDALTSSMRDALRKMSSTMV